MATLAITEKANYQTADPESGNPEPQTPVNETADPDTTTASDTLNQCKKILPRLDS